MLFDLTKLYFRCRWERIKLLLKAESIQVTKRIAYDFIYLAVSIGKFKLTPGQLYERKKLIRDLEKRKKETINRRRRVSKGAAAFLP